MHCSQRPTRRQTRTQILFDRVSPQFVANCAQSFTTDQDLLDARRELDKKVAAAVGRPVEGLEADDEFHGSFGIIKKVEEKDI